jgi:hypothetical protein
MTIAEYDEQPHPNLLLEKEKGPAEPLASPRRGLE